MKTEIPPPPLTSDIEESEAWKAMEQNYGTVKELRTIIWNILKDLMEWCRP